eukprot:GHVQ01022384.1.p1 GENE.GHVQ01022384.1~~GHVQ01022384.1.p1  ORF type:complete len:343 (-),score=19.66 GHVQ01022384.1:490-1518(-)
MVQSFTITVGCRYLLHSLTRDFKFYQVYVISKFLLTRDPLDNDAVAFFLASLLFMESRTEEMYEVATRCREVYGASQPVAWLAVCLLFATSFATLVVHVQEGCRRIARGDVEKGTECMRGAVKLCPASDLYLFVYGNTFALRSTSDLALNLYRNSIRLQPWNHRGYLYMAMELLGGIPNRANIRQARIALHLAAKITPWDPAVLNELGRLASLEKLYGESLMWLHLAFVAATFIGESSNGLRGPSADNLTISGLVGLNLGLESLRCGVGEGAANMLRLVLNECPMSPRAHEALGKALYVLRHPTAVAVLEQSIALRETPDRQMEFLRSMASSGAFQRPRSLS